MDDDDGIEVIDDETEDDDDETGFEDEESILEADEINAEDDNDDSETDDNPTLTFRVFNGHINSKCDELTAMIQAVDKIFKTERFVYPIYDDQYGHDLYELIGTDESYATVEAERMITEALEADDRVTDVVIDSIEPTGRDALTITGTCSTVYGDISIEREVALNES